MFLFKRSNGFYYVIYSDNLTGKKKSKTTKCRLKNEAVKFLNEFQAQPASPAVSNVIYLETLQDEVLKYASNNLTQGSHAIYKLTFRYLHTIIGNKPIKLITGRDIELYKDTRIKTVRKTTCNIEI